MAQTRIGFLSSYRDSDYYSHQCSLFIADKSIGLSAQLLKPPHKGGLLVFLISFLPPPEGDKRAIMQVIIKRVSH